MSIFAFGDILLTKWTIDTELLANKIARIAEAENVYIKFGGNVSSVYFRVAQKQVPCLQFEMTDSIVENTAELLFALPNSKNYMGDFLLPNRPWSERMSSVAELIKQIMNFSYVSEIILNIGLQSYMESQQYKVECTASTFQSFLQQIYQEDRDTIDPCASIHIHK